MAIRRSRGERSLTSLPPMRISPEVGASRRFVTARDLGEHGGNDPRFEGLVDGGRTIAGIANVGGPIQDVSKDFVLVGRSRARIVGDFLLKVWNGARETREIVELSGNEAVMKGIDDGDQELLGAVFVFGEVPDDIAIHDVLGGYAADRALQGAGDHDFAVDREMFALGLTRNGDGVRNIGDAAGKHGLVVGWRSPSEDFRSF